jgi:hypothetical protein
VVIPDSQYLVARYTNRWNDQIAWIINNQAALNIKAVMHLGDLVDITNPAQLRAAMWGLNSLRDAGVPLIMTPGNHDQDINGPPGMMANLSMAGLTPSWYFNYSNYGVGWSMGFQNPTNLLGSYLLITNGTQPYLLGCTTWLPNVTNLTWISNVFLTYSNVPAIYFQHVFVGQRADGRISSWSDPWSVERGGLAPAYYTPTYLWTNWIEGTRNIFWVASGHELDDSNSSFYSAPANDGHIVTFTLTDFQNWFLNGQEGSNFMQLVTIDPAANQARVSTFSPTFTNNPPAYSNMNYTFPLRTTRRPPLSPWQSKQAESAKQHGLALYVNFEDANPVKDLSPFAAPMVNGNTIFKPTELGTSAFFAGGIGPAAQGVFAGKPLSHEDWKDKELDQFSRLRQATISCWFKTTNTIWSDRPHALVTKFRDGTFGDFALVAPTNASTLSFITINTSRQRVNLDAPTPSLFYDGRWHHFCGVYDGTKMCCYYDGRLLATARQTGEIQPTGNAACIGYADGGAIACWDGWIDEVKVLTTAWTPVLVSAEYQRVTSMLRRANGAPAARR